MDQVLPFPRQTKQLSVASPGSSVLGMLQICTTLSGKTSLLRRLTVLMQHLWSFLSLSTTRCSAKACASYFVKAGVLHSTALQCSAHPPQIVLPLLNIKIILENFLKIFILRLFILFCGKRLFSRPLSYCGLFISFFLLEKRRLQEIVIWEQTWQWRWLKSDTRSSCRCPGCVITHCHSTLLVEAFLCLKEQK